MPLPDLCVFPFYAPRLWNHKRREMTQENHPLRLFIIKKKYQIAAKEQLKDKEAEEGKTLCCRQWERTFVYTLPLYFSELQRLNPCEPFHFSTLTDCDTNSQRKKTLKNGWILISIVNKYELSNRYPSVVIFNLLQATNLNFFWISTRFAVI